MNFNSRLFWKHTTYIFKDLIVFLAGDSMTRHAETDDVVHHSNRCQQWKWMTSRIKKLKRKHDYTLATAPITDHDK